MAIGKERYTRNVIYIGGGPSLDEGHGIMYLLGEDGMMYYYDYPAPDGPEVRDQFMKDVAMHCNYLDGRMRISFVFATNMIHTLTQIVHPSFLGMNAELPPLDGPEDGDADDAAFDAPGDVAALAGTENVPHEAVGSVESIADTPIPFELWLFSIKKLGQNFAAASQNYERLSPEEQEALMQEYNDTFGF